MVVRVNTPGGSVFASELIRDALIRVKEKNIPIVTSMGALPLQVAIGLLLQQIIFLQKI